MNEEMKALQIDLPIGKIPVGCRWVFTIKYKVDGTVEWLRKSLYGLKQSPRAWFGRFTSFMKSIGYKQSNSYHTLFLKHNKEQIIALIVCVDDMIVIGNDYEEMKTLQEHLAHDFEMKDLDKLKYFLGIEVSRSKKAYALSVVCQFMHSPSKEHMNVVIHILRYLKSSPGKGILFTKGDNLDINGYTDADWAGSIQDRCSTSWYFTFKVVARSNAEAEYKGMAKAICELLWIRNLVKDLHIKQVSPMKLYCDNKAACDIAHNPVQHDRTKYVEVGRHFIKEKLESKLIEVPHVRSQDQLADVLTKAMSNQAMSEMLKNPRVMEKAQAERFYPERFLDSSIDYKCTDFGYVPFGAGRRICPGIPFAMPYIELPLAHLLYHFDWKLPKGIKAEDLDMTEAFCLAVCRKQDLHLIPIPYNPLHAQ
uniref:Reverse transcriptase Ty1/copia-type domain-containing protein n=1 Tax=Vitis vinifera TaxID=29760 RepID=A5BV16_VITVI|nr:hypothetical protein VITISV_035755 [Vitis vinifera]